jgi:hypothetical protein
MAKFNLQAPLVGMRFRPPAEDVVKNLPSDTEVLLRRQEDNPHDPDAIQVLLSGFSEGGQHQQLRKKLLEGRSEDEQDAFVDPLPLGYIANSEKTGGRFASEISKVMAADSMDTVPGKLVFGASGNPQVVVAWDTQMASDMLPGAGTTGQPGASEAVPGIGPRQDVVTAGYDPDTAPPGMNQGEFARELMIAPDKASLRDRTPDRLAEGTGVQRMFQAMAGQDPGPGPAVNPTPAARQGLQSTATPTARGVPATPPATKPQTTGSTPTRTASPPLTPGQSASPNKGDETK